MITVLDTVLCYASQCFVCCAVLCRAVLAHPSPVCDGS